MQHIKKKKERDNAIYMKKINKLLTIFYSSELISIYIYIYILFTNKQII